MHNHLSIGLALELEPLCFKLLPELGIVLDDTVVDNGELVIIAHVGMGIDIRGLPMGGPAGMADAGGAWKGRPSLRLVVQIFDHSDGFDHLNAILSQYRHAGGIVSSIFQLLQPVQQNGGRILAAGKSDNSTHVFPPFSACWRTRLIPGRGLRAASPAGGA